MPPAVRVFVICCEASASGVLQELQDAVAGIQDRVVLSRDEAELATLEELTKAVGREVDRRERERRRAAASN